MMPPRRGRLEVLAGPKAGNDRNDDAHREGQDVPMDPDEHITLTPIGHVRSPLKETGDAPCQPDEGAPAATIVLDPSVQAAAVDIVPGDRLVVVTWLHAASRDVLHVHPRGDRNRPSTGVFSTRSPDRPNPVGLHTVTVRGVGPGRIDVDALEAIDGTPVIDLKPVLGEVDGR
jgi:tRNA-Thr(GGU) m(6)t(6)A37 methyltransferase TsaA